MEVGFNDLGDLRTAGIPEFRTSDPLSQLRPRERAALAGFFEVSWKRPNKSPSAFGPEQELTFQFCREKVLDSLLLAHSDAGTQISDSSIIKFLSESNE